MARVFCSLGISKSVDVVIKIVLKIPRPSGGKEIDILLDH